MSNKTSLESIMQVTLTVFVLATIIMIFVMNPTWVPILAGYVAMGFGIVAILFMLGALIGV